jgi:protein-L-isoaspartate(D-aspartate) O-methyltransferase
MLPLPPNPPSTDRHSLFPRRDELERLIRETIESRGIQDPRVLDVLRGVPRHAFVPELVARAAYQDCPLPIGWGQTISQPYIVALMTEAAMPDASDRCLEIGTGSGYQTAVLSMLCQEVYSIEQASDLFNQGQRNLQHAGYLNGQVHLRCGDGYYGWPEAAPFDLIVVTAAPPKVPEPLVLQLAMRGRLIIPIGPEMGIQRLERWTRCDQGCCREAFTVEGLLDVRFVPMVGAVQLP